MRKKGEPYLSSEPSSLSAVDDCSLFTLRKKIATSHLKINRRSQGKLISEGEAK